MELQGIDHTYDVENSSADATIYCSPCEKGGGSVPANGFCNNCKEHLCLSCLKVHQEDHVVVSDDGMPSFYSSIRTDGKKRLTGLTEHCPSHSNEVINFFCSKHDPLSCRYCIADDHNSCRTDYIPNIAKHFVQGKGFERLNTNIAKVDRDLKNCGKLIETCLNTVDEDVTEELDQIRALREELVAFLDMREKELLAKVNDIKKTNDDNIQSFKKRCQVAKDKMNAIKSSLESHENNINQLFVVAQQSKRQLEKIETTLDDINSSMSMLTFNFVRDHATTDLMKSLTALGTIKETKKKMPLQKQTMKGFPFKKASSAESVAWSSQDSRFYPCWVSGLKILSEDNILIADYGYESSSVKILETKRNKTVSQLKMDSYPWQLCLVTPTKAAVTLPRQATINL